MTYPTQPELEALTKAELEEMALEYGIPGVTASLLKAEMIAVMLQWFADNPEAAKTLLDEATFKPVDSADKDIKSQFKVEDQIVNRAGRPDEKIQASIVPPPGWGGGHKE